jgi:hypothetical protein
MIKLYLLSISFQFFWFFFILFPGITKKLNIIILNNIIHQFLNFLLQNYIIIQCYHTFQRQLVKPTMHQKKP